MIEKIENLPAELQMLSFCGEEFLPETHIRIPESGTAEKVARLHAERPSRGLSESRLVEIDCRVGKVARLEMGVAHEVPELISATRADACVIHVLADRKRRAGL